MINNWDWIPVEKELPSVDEYVLWLMKSGAYFMGCIDKDMDINDFLRERESGDKVTHWIKPVLPWERKE